MADATTFMNQYAQNILTLVNTLLILERQNQQLTDDSTIITRYFSQPAGQFRTDIVAADVTNAQNAIVQMLFTYNSGTPTQAQFLLKMIP